MNVFRNIWSSTDRPPHSVSTPMTPNQSTSDAPDGDSGGTRSRLTGHRRSQSRSQPQSQPRHDATQTHTSSRRRDHVQQYSPYSTQGPFASRMFFSENFMLGAGAVIIQPSSGKVVVVQDGDSWFLPKGRKDLGESIEQAALREAYEEVRLSHRLIPSRSRLDPRSSVWLPLPVPAPLPLDKLAHRDTSGLRAETHGAAIRHHNFVCGTSEQTTWRIHDLLVRVPDRTRSGELWFPPSHINPIGSQGAPGQVRETGTGMPDEAGYIGHLATFEQADQLLREGERWVLAAARNEWVRSLAIDEQIRVAEAQETEGGQQSNIDGERA